METRCTPAMLARSSGKPDRTRPDVRIGFKVADLDAFHERMLTNEVPCVQEPAVRFGARLPQYSGPDGLVFSVGEARPD